jgi:folate-dependent phosphoribosylglycinamide formyltransferase PurN
MGNNLHFMTEALDEGDIIHQKLEIVFADTNTVSALELEKEVFYEL